MKLNEFESDLGRECLRTILRPVVRFALRSSQRLGDLVDLLKELFIEIAREELVSNGERPSMSRIHTMTGVHRQDVSSVVRDRNPPQRLRQSVTARVLGQWESDKRFHTKAGKPRILRAAGMRNEFAELVASVSKSVTAQSVLAELERMGTVRRKANAVQLQRPESHYRGDAKRIYNLMSRNVESLFHAGEQNAFDLSEVPNPHIRTEFDNIIQSEIPNVRRWILQETLEFHKRVRAYLSEKDKDLSASDSDGGGKVVLTSFGLTSPQESSEALKQASS